MGYIIVVDVMSYTTLPIHKDTRELLMQVSLPKESWDDTIRRLMDEAAELKQLKVALIGKHEED